MNAKQTTNVFRIFSVDSFSDNAFSGNPAAVCLDNSLEGLSETNMQKIATKMNISETAFIKMCSPNSTFKEADQFQLRWFTPTNEVNLCGHATLATAAVLFNELDNSNSEVKFETKSGVLKARQADSKIVLDFPLNNPENIERKSVETLLKAACGNLSICDLRFCTTTKKLLIRLDDSFNRTDIESHKPDIDKFVSIHSTVNVQGVILTLKGSKENGCKASNGTSYDFVSRYFSPWNGIPEDPATGSAHTVLAAYWAKELNKRQLYGYQCSARGGELWLSLRDDNRLDIAGNATIVLKGTISF